MDWNLILPDGFLNSGKTATISRNATGCNSVQEVYSACGITEICNPGTLSSQEEIDNFPSNYRHCTQIGGDLVILVQTIGDIVNLDSLTQISNTRAHLAVGTTNQYCLLGQRENTSFYDISHLTLRHRFP